MERTTLIYIEKDDKYLMLHRTKKENDLNAGFWIGVGGHIEEGETPDEAIVREVKEETGLKLLSLDKRGIIYFSNNEFEEEMHLYTSTEFEGEIIECNEGDLQWINIDDVLMLPLWEGDKVFLELLRMGEPYFELKLMYNNKKLAYVERLK